MQSSLKVLLLATHELSFSAVHDSKKAPTSDPTSSMLGTLQGLEAGFQGEHSMVSGRPYNSEQAYKDSKLCNVMIALELARRLKAENVPVTCNCFAPGLIPTTGLFREYNAYALYVFDFFMRHVLQLAVTEEEGGRRLAHMIGSPELEGVTGAYFARNAKTGLFEAVSPSAEALDTDKAAKLWMVTDRLLHNRK